MRLMMAIRAFCTRVSTSGLLSVIPSSSMVDSKVVIKANGLEANSHVTIRSQCQQETRSGTVKFEAHAHYIADDTGVISVPDQTSWGGTYTGTEPMGLFWSMKLSPGQRFGSRFTVKDVTKPILVNLTLHHGHLDTETLQTAKLEASSTVERWYMGKDVERIEVRDGQLRGAVFKPKGQGPFLGVIDIYGSAGGLMQSRAALLASHGFASFALPYFKYDDLPSYLWEYPLEYFKEAIDWMSDQPFVKPGGLAVVGISLGGQNALAMVSHFPEKIKAVVSISGCHIQTTFPFTLNGQILPFLEFDPRGIKPSATVAGATDMFDSYNEVYSVKQEDAVAFQLENGPHIQFLFIAGQNDRLWNSCHYAREAIRRLASHGLHNYQLVTYPNAGHLIEVPYAPSDGVAYAPVTRSVSDHGGSIEGNAKAMEDCWPKIIRFLHRHSGVNAKL